MDIVRELFTNFGTVFAIIDPFGYVPIFLILTATDDEQKRRWMLKRACGTALVVLVLATFIGKPVLSFFGISIPALQISGGLVLLAVAFEMLKVLPVNEKLSTAEEIEAVAKPDISIVPLAIPMLSGPASIAAVIVLSADGPTTWGHASTVFSTVITLGFTYLILRSATRVMKFVGLTGLNVMTRVMGLLLCAMAIQFLINGYLALRPAGNCPTLPDEEYTSEFMPES